MKRTGLFILMIGLVSGGAWWWTHRQTTQDKPVYTTRALQKGSVRSKVTATGTLQAVTEVLVGSQVSGNIEQLYVGYNSAVKKGQPLAQLDPSSYQAKVTQAEASVSNAVANLENARGDLGNASANVKSAEAAILGAQAKLQQAQAGVLTARASIDSALASLEKARANRDNARISYERNRELRSRDLIPQSDLDTSEANYRSAEADVSSAESSYAGARAGLTSAETVVSSARADVQAARIKKDASVELLAGAQSKIGGFQAQVTQAQANLDTATIDLQRTTITSPIDGIVLDVAITAGQTVAAQLQAPDLFTLAKNLDQMQVETSVDEADIGRVKVGTRAAFTVDAFPEERFEGLVEEVRQAPVVTSNVVTYTVIVSTRNPDLMLKPGMTATVEIYDQERGNVLLVPNEALRFKPSEAEKTDESLVYTLEGSRLVSHSISTGVSDETFSEVLESDLQEGAEVVVSSSDAARRARQSATPSPAGSRNSGRPPRMFR